MKSNIVNVSISSSNLSSYINLVGRSNISNGNNRVNSNLQISTTFDRFEIKDIEDDRFEGNYPNF